MDIPCPVCAEPWDNDSFHEVAEAEVTDYVSVLRAFQRNGCNALSSVYGNMTCERTERGYVASALHDLLGDDSDGIAAMMEDFDMFA